ncbi:MAG: nicotinate-nucleotide--dimethylbenzimidazole phosphoribosyltransferase [Christensenellales bacterium]
MIQAYISQIAPLDQKAMDDARARQASLAKPPNSLGRLEEISIRFCGIAGRLDSSAKKRRILIFSADNGVVAEGVASAPQSVTRMQTINFTRGLTGVAALARHYHVDLHVLDVGVNADIDCPGVENHKIAYGTKNIAREAAMTRAQAIEAIGIGIEAAERAAREGYEIIGVGEMGIGNTTTSAAVLSALTELSPARTTGRGGGVNDAGLLRKREIVRDAIAREKPDPSDPVDILAKVGGFDIAAMAGAYIGAAHARLPVVIDGSISAVAALCAQRLAPICADFMFASHASFEAGYEHAIRALGLKPMFDLEMRLGEGSGCALAFEVIDAALSVLKTMGTFAEAQIDDGYLGEIRADARLQR